MASAATLLTALFSAALKAFFLLILVIPLLLLMKLTRDPFYLFTASLTTNQAYIPWEPRMRNNSFEAVKVVSTPLTKSSSQQCTTEYGSLRAFDMNETSHTNPPILYSFPGTHHMRNIYSQEFTYCTNSPGSGSTWCRLLIEYATGLYTGSVYNEKALLGLLPGENTCNKSVAVIRVHAHTHGYRTGVKPLVRGISSADDTCAKSSVQEVHRAIVLVRNPFDAIWSNYQRMHLKKHSILRISRVEFDREDWTSYALRHAKWYKDFWTHYTDMLHSLRHSNILLVKFEDLAHRGTLHKIVRFLGYSSSERRLKCAFTVSKLELIMLIKHHHESFVVFDMYAVIRNQRNSQRLHNLG